MTDEKFKEGFLEKVETIKDRLWWIALWIFIIAVNSCDISGYLKKVAK